MAGRLVGKFGKHWFNFRYLYAYKYMKFKYYWKKYHDDTLPGNKSGTPYA